MNIFEKRIADKMGMPHVKDFYGIQMDLESVEIKNGRPKFNYIAPIPGQGKKINMEFHIHFSKDD